MNLCVYASSSTAVASEYLEAAAELGTRMAARGHTLVYGGGNVGLMGALARAVHDGGGHVIGVIPEKLRDLELAYEAADELLVTATMRERKLEMEARADAFVALPGGFGTLEEVMEVLVLRQLGYHWKPVVFLNTAGVYTPLFEFFERLVRDRFVKPEQSRLYTVAETPEDVISTLERT